MAYQSKQNKKETYAKLKVAKSSFEDNEWVRLYLKWESLPQSEKRISRMAWDKYYNDVKNTRAYSMFKEMSVALQKSDKKNVDFLMKESSSMLIDQLDGRYELPEPTSINPYDINSHNGIISAYLSTKSRIKSMQKESLDLDLRNIF